MLKSQIKAPCRFGLAAGLFLYRFACGFPSDDASVQIVNRESGGAQLFRRSCAALAASAINQHRFFWVELAFGFIEKTVFGDSDESRSLEVAFIPFRLGADVQKLRAASELLLGLFDFDGTSNRRFGRKRNGSKGKQGRGGDGQKSHDEDIVRSGGLCKDRFRAAKSRRPDCQRCQFTLADCRRLSSIAFIRPHRRVLTVIPILSSP